MSRKLPLRHLSSSIHEASLVPTRRHPSALLELVNTPINRQFVEHIVVRLVDVAALALLDRQPECSFDSLASLADFVVRVVQTCRLSTGTMLGALVYLERIKPNLRILSSKLATHRIFMASALIASKYLNDANMTNADWASCSPFPVRELLLMELEFLHILDYRLAVDEVDLISLHASICQPHRIALSTLPQRALARRVSGSTLLAFGTPSGRASPMKDCSDMTLYSSPCSPPPSPISLAGCAASPVLSPLSDAVPVSRPSSSSSEQSEATVVTPRDGRTFESALVVAADEDEPDFAFIYSTYSPDSDESFESGFPLGCGDAAPLSPSQLVFLTASFGPVRTPVSRSFPTSALRSENAPIVTQVAPLSESRDVWWKQATHRRVSSGLTDITNAAATHSARDDLMEVDITSLAKSSPIVDRGVKRKERRGLVDTPPPTRRARVAFH